MTGGVGGSGGHRLEWLPVQGQATTAQVSVAGCSLVVSAGCRHLAWHGKALLHHSARVAKSVLELLVDLHAKNCFSTAQHKEILNFNVSHYIMCS